MALTGKQIKNTYKDILTVNSGTDNQGIESSLKAVTDGEGVATAIELSTTTLKIPTGKTLQIEGTLNSVDATLTGDLSVGDDLTVTDLIRGNSLSLGNGYANGGTDISGSGNIQTAGDVKSAYLKILTKTTSQLASVTGIDGQLAYDSDKKAFMVWKP